MKNKKKYCYTLTMIFKCQTKKQAKELSDRLNQVFGEKVDEWTGGFASKFEGAKRTKPKNKLPKNWGK